MNTVLPKFEPEQYSGLSEEKITALGKLEWFSPEVPQPASYEVIREPWGLDRWDSPDGTEYEETGGPLFRLTMSNGAMVEVWPSSGGEEFFDEWKMSGPDWEKWLEYVRMDTEFADFPEDFYYCFRDYVIDLARAALSDSDLLIPQEDEDTAIRGNVKVNLSDLGFYDKMLDPFHGVKPV